MGRPIRTKPDSKSGGNKMLLFKVGGVFLLVAAILFATDSIEINLKGNTVEELDNVKVKPQPSSPVAAPTPSGASEPLTEESTPEETTTTISSPVASPTLSDASKPSTDESTSTATTSTDGGSSSTQSNTNRRTYQRRGKPISDADREAMIAKWGSWTLVDNKERPQHDYFKAYPNRDIPRNNFPSNAWQTDSEYLSKFLPESIALVQRAQEAILAEYGKTEGTFEERSEMFKVELIPDEELATATGLDSFGRRGVRNGRESTYKGGWSTPTSWDGLKRRMLHAVMTEDSFIFAMGGHSAAAGHGNLFQQSYTLQVQWILEAVFARLGVRHQSRNFGNGGLGTVHNGLGAASVYGPDVDVLMWDSGMTEGDTNSIDVMHRQQILAGLKVPVIWGLHGGLSQEFFVKAGADTGYIGTADFGIPVATSVEEIEAMPWAMQYVRCDNELHQICRSNEYIGHCWIERDDVTPTTNQQAEPGGRAGWHPGNRIHQVRGRVIAFTFLQALKEALTQWNEAEGYVLADDAWHLTERYDKVRNTILASPDDIGWCKSFEENFGLGYFCKYPMQARTEFTPRSYPPLTNLRTLMHPDMAAEVGEGPKNIYEPPDVFNPDLHPPAGAIDVLNIVEAGVEFRSVLAPDYVTDYYKKPDFSKPPSLPVGKGIDLNTASGDDFCDGSVDSFCNRGKGSGCLLYGHNDGRNGVLINGYSGWAIFNLPGLKNGIIALKSETWHFDDDGFKTRGWTSINNEGGRRRLGSSRFNTRNVRYVNENSTTAILGEDFDVKDDRRLGKRQVPDYCDEFQFEYAIDGKMTYLNKTEFLGRVKQVQRVVEIIPLLYDPNYTGGEEKQVEVAVRMTGCGVLKNHLITHIYWS